MGALRAWHVAAAVFFIGGTVLVGVAVALLARRRDGR